MCRPTLPPRPPVSEIIKRPSLPLVAVPVDFRRLVKARRRQLHARHIGLVDQFGEAISWLPTRTRFGQEGDLLDRHLVMGRGKIDQPLLDRARGVAGGHAVEVRPGRRRGRRGIGDLSRRGRRDLDVRIVDLEFSATICATLVLSPWPISVPPWLR